MSALTPEVRQLLRLSDDLQRQPTLDGVLQRFVDGAAALLSIDHVSIRLLDASRTLLLTSARAGDPFHQNKTFEFVMGEGLVGWVAKNGQTLRLANAEFEPALTALLVDETAEGGKGAVDFRSLSVREFGTIYEGLLESELAIAPSDLTLDKDGAFVPAGEGDAVVVPAEAVYFHNRSGTRKATGSYFTPACGCT
jgi:hypothetical protein